MMNNVNFSQIIILLHIFGGSDLKHQNIMQLTHLNKCETVMEFFEFTFKFPFKL